MTATRSLLFTAAAVLLIASGCSDSKTKTITSPTRHKAEEGNYVRVEDEDQGMADAIAKAQASSAEFLAAFREKKPGAKEFYVKKPYPTPSGSQEHMWILVQSEDKGTLTGLVSNDAEDTKAVKLGDRVTLKMSEISDWKYQVGKKLIGGYTIRYLLEKASPEERKQVLEGAGFEL